MLNKVTLIGNLGADPEARYTQDGTCVCNLRLATTEKFKDKQGQKQEKTEWHRVVLWGKVGEIANQYLSKGSKVYIEGKIETRKWTNKEGQDQYTTEIRGNELKMLGSQQQSQGNQGGIPSRGGQSSTNGASNRQDPFAETPVFGDVPDEDSIPF